MFKSATSHRSCDRQQCSRGSLAVGRAHSMCSSLPTAGSGLCHTPCLLHTAAMYAKRLATPCLQHRRVTCSSSSSAAASNSAGLGSAAAAPAIPGIKIRKGGTADLPLIWTTILDEKMNPLGIDPHRFLIATITAAVHPEGGPLHKPPARGEQVVGVGQLKPRQPPTGAAPGVKEFELSSLIVQKEYRGKGIGTWILQSLQQQVARGDRITAVTLASSRDFYERCGFTVLDGDHIPQYLSFELAAGTVVARLAVNQPLIVMAWTRTA